VHVTRPIASIRFCAFIAFIATIMVVASGVGSHYPEDWLLENLMVAASVAYLAWTYRAVPLSRASYVSILVFLGLHEVGAHWTFAEVPYDAWWRALFGETLNEVMGWERNHYDRLVHLSYGVLITLPMKETLEVRLGIAGRASSFVTWIFMFASAAFYELVEWVGALVFGGDLGMAYLGTQGDVWDSHKDTALAILGSFLTLVVLAGLARRKRVRERE
jgi:putative membrane protein